MIYRIETSDKQYVGHTHTEERAIEVASEMKRETDDFDFRIVKTALKNLYDFEQNVEIVCEI